MDAICLRKIIMSDFRDKVIQFAKRNESVTNLKFILEDLEGFRLKRIGEGGLVNIILHVESSNRNQSLVIKYAEEKLSCEKLTQLKLSVERMEIEYHMLAHLHQLLPGCVAEPYCFDNEMNMVAMEDLSHMEIFGPVLLSAPQPEAARRIGAILGRMQYLSHRQTVSSDTWQLYQRHFAFSDHLSSFAYLRYSSRLNEEVMMDSVVHPGLRPLFLDCVAKLRVRGVLERLPDIVTRHDCLVHSDCHLFSIFLTDNRIAFIDFENGGLGNQSFAIGYLSGSFVMCMMVAIGKKQDGICETAIINKAREAITNLVMSFCAEFEEHRSVFGSQDMFFSDMSLLLGWTLFVLHNICGIDDLILLTLPQRWTLTEKGFNLMFNHQKINTLDQILAIVCGK